MQADSRQRSDQAEQRHSYEETHTPPRSEDGDKYHRGDECHHENDYGVNHHRKTGKAMDAAELVQAAQTATQSPSLRALAQRAGLDHAQISKWQRGELQITLEGALILARLANLKPEAIAGKLVVPRTDSPVLREILKAWSKIAALLLVTLISRDVYCKELQFSTNTFLHNDTHSIQRRHYKVRKALNLLHWIFQKVTGITSWSFHPAASRLAA